MTKVGTGRTLIGQVALIVAVALPGCGSDAVDDAQYESRTSSLYAPHDAVLWPQAPWIPVCWVLPGFDAEKATMVDALRNTWGLYGPVAFTGFGICPTEGSERFIRVLVQRDPNLAWGTGSASIGMGALRSPTSDANDRSVHIVLPANGHQGRTEYLAVHEFGHVLGFAHEQDRGDNSDAPDPTCNPTGSIGGTYYSPYDPASIMHYCNSGGNTSGLLSDSDKLAIARVYGPNKHWPLNQTIAYTGNTGPFVNVNGGFSDFAMSTGGYRRVRFHYDYASAPSPSGMVLDIQMNLDGPPVASVTGVGPGVYTFDRVVYIGAGNHTVSFSVRSRLVSGPPAGVAMRGAPAWIEIEGASTRW